MSWISDLAGKAENILNKIDQNAASVLQHPSSSSSSSMLLSSSTTSHHNNPPTAAVVDKNLNLKSIAAKNPMKLSPRKSQISKVSSKSDLETLSSAVKSIDQISNSNISSRRSSFSSKTDLTDEIISIDPNPPPLPPPSVSNVIPTVNQELAAFKIALAEIKTERDELKEEIAILQEELNQANGANVIRDLEIQNDDLCQQRSDLNEKLQQLTESNEAYVKSISELEMNLSKARNNLGELNEKYLWQSKEIQHKCSELEQYRKKAQNTLQMKDKLIEELKNKQLGTDEHLEQSNERILQFEIDGMKQENLMKSNELAELKIQLEHSKIMLRKYESQLNQLRIDADQEKQLMKNSLKIEINKSEESETELRHLNQEILAIRHESNRQNEQLLAQLHHKDQELVKQKMRHEKSAENVIGDGNSIEMRMKSLTQALVQKQTTIESITADKNAMKLQLERVEDQLRLVVAQNRTQRNQVINVNDTDDAKASLPFIMRENPFDTRVTRRVKRAYSSLDSFGFQIGVFLRRFPLARVFVLIYVTLLHVLVMFVLLSSTPS